MDVLTVKEFVMYASMFAGPTGAAWIGVKVALNGTRAKVKEINTKVDNIEAMLLKQSVDYEHRFTLLEAAANK